MSTTTPGFSHLVLEDCWVYRTPTPPASLLFLRPIKHLCTSGPLYLRLCVRLSVHFFQSLLSLHLLEKGLLQPSLTPVFD